MNYHGIFFRQFPLQLANRFNKRKTFNITYRTANFCNHNIIFIILSQAAASFV